MGKNRKLFVSISILLLVLLAIEDRGMSKEDTSSVRNERISHDTIGQQAQQMHALLEMKRAEGFDVSKIEELDRLSQKAAAKGDLNECLRLINEAKSVLEKLKDLPAEVKEVTVELPIDAKK